MSIKLLRTRSFVAASLVIGSAAAQDVAPPWYESFQAAAFIDAYSSVNYNFPKPQTGRNAYRAYDVTNGFALAWAGVDISRAPDPAGGTLALRFGPSAALYNAHPDIADANNGLLYVKQAFVSFRPGGEKGDVTLDLGKFDTWCGAEVADSQLNMNYTRGVLYWLGQPLFHTGARVAWQVAEPVALKVGVVNGWNNSIDNNLGKSFMAHVAITPAKWLAITPGWLGGPEQPDNVVCVAGQSFDPTTGHCIADPTSAGQSVGRDGANKPEAWRHLFDLVIAATPTEELSLLLNLDYAFEGVRVQDDPADPTRIRAKRESWYGGMLGARYQLTDVWAVAGRGEYYADPDGKTTGVEGLKLATGTLTLEAQPAKALLVRLEQRGDFVLTAARADEERVFPRSAHDFSKNQITTTLGVVLRTP